MADREAAMWGGPGQRLFWVDDDSRIVSRIVIT